MSKAGTISSKRAKRSGTDYEIATAIAETVAKPITKRRIVLASLCSVALLAAIVTMPFSNFATSSSQIAATQPVPIIRADRTAPVGNTWTSVRSEDVTGAISKKKKKKSGKTKAKTKHMKAAEEPNSLGDWFSKTFSGDDKTAPKRTSAID